MTLEQLQNMGRIQNLILNTDWEGAPSDSSLTMRLGRFNESSQSTGRKQLVILSSCGGRYRLQEKRKSVTQWGRRKGSKRRKQKSYYLLNITIYPNTRNNFLKIQPNENALYFTFKLIGLPMCNCKGWICGKNKNDKEIQYEIKDESVEEYLDTRSTYFIKRHVSTYNGYSHYVKPKKSKKQKQKRKLSDSDNVTDGKEAKQPPLKKQRLTKQQQ
eukprot:16209_1